jgi:hypothetical protein
MRWVIPFLFSSAAFAQQPAVLTFSPDDQANLREVCRAAMQNANLNTQVVYNISAWCLNKENEVKQAVQKPKEEPKP